jgi:hypothetical protein
MSRWFIVTPLAVRRPRAALVMLHGFTGQVWARGCDGVAQTSIPGTAPEPETATATGSRPTTWSFGRSCRWRSPARRLGGAGDYDRRLPPTPERVRVVARVGDLPAGRTPGRRGQRRGHPWLCRRRWRPRPTCGCRRPGPPRRRRSTAADPGRGAVSALAATTAASASRAGEDETGGIDLDRPGQRRSPPPPRPWVCAPSAAGSARATRPLRAGVAAGAHLPRCCTGAQVRPRPPPDRNAAPAHPDPAALAATLSEQTKRHRPSKHIDVVVLDIGPRV